MPNGAIVVQMLWKTRHSPEDRMCAWHCKWGQEPEARVTGPKGNLLYYSADVHNIELTHKDLSLHPQRNGSLNSHQRVLFVADGNRHRDPQLINVQRIRGCRDAQC